MTVFQNVRDETVTVSGELRYRVTEIFKLAAPEKDEWITKFFVKLGVRVRACFTVFCVRNGGGLPASSSFGAEKRKRAGHFEDPIKLP